MENEKLTVIRQVVEEGFGKGDMHTIDQLISDHIIEHQFSMKGGKEGLKKAIASLILAFSGRRYELLHYSVEGDIVWVHYRYSAIHTGEFMGRAATGKEFSIDVIDVSKIRNGQIVEHWGVPDRFALLMQLGFLQPTHSETQTV